MEFLSTPSARRATGLGDRFLLHQGISIHALREEGDIMLVICEQRAVKFLSTPSARRATSPSMTARSVGRYFYPRPPRGGRRSSSASIPRPTMISIHALREEGDLDTKIEQVCRDIISIHALREEGDDRARPLSRARL